MARTHFAEGQILFTEGDPADSVFRLLRGTVDVLRELDGYPILLGRVGVGQFVGEMGVVEKRPRSATARAASEVEAEILTPSEFLEEIVSSPQTARELILRLSQRLRQADDRIVDDERRNEGYHVRDLASTIGTIVNGEPIGHHFRTDDASLRAGENEVIAGGTDSSFVFSVFIA